MPNQAEARVDSVLPITLLTFAIFFMFAMTTDAVGEIIKLAKDQLQLSNTRASAFHWATMVAIAMSGFALGFTADRYGRKAIVILGLGIYGTTSILLFWAASFQALVALLFVSGLAIGLFKSASLAMIGDIARSTAQHTKLMNAVEGFFALGAIIGPGLVVFLSARGLDWRYVYLIAGAMCAAMMLASARTRFPAARKTAEATSIGTVVGMLGNKYALGFSFAIAMYVAAEVAIFVWLPTLLDGFSGSELSALLASYAVMVFFICRALGRFVGIWLLSVFKWTTLLALFSAIIFACFAVSAALGPDFALWLLPFSGLFMSMIYPTLNSKGISCFPKSQHGAIAGLILFFTAVAAAVGPLLMALADDALGDGDLRVGFYLATVFSGLLFVCMLWNWIRDPAAATLGKADRSDYECANPEAAGR